MALILYLGNRFFYRLAEFFRHWYKNSFRIYGHFVISTLEKLDQSLAWRITLKHLFEPLYQDRSFIGYILGFIFRVGRLIIGGAIHLFLITIALLLYLSWLVIPVFIISKILNLPIPINIPNFF
ncbi:hypothetical protein HYV91_02660 [Candidatus Wolfebacteria bacterium]|nr:hypothetical protein [Candidatus Wolfebacteria bacterium]